MTNTTALPFARHRRAQCNRFPVPPKQRDFYSLAAQTHQEPTTERNVPGVKPPLPFLSEFSYPDEAAVLLLL